MSHCFMLLIFLIIELGQVNLECSLFFKKKLFDILTLSPTLNLGSFSLFSLSKLIYILALILWRMGGFVTSTSLRISHKKIQNFSFNPFVTLILNFNTMPTANHKLEPRTLIKKVLSQKRWGYQNPQYILIHVIKFYW